MLPVGCSVLSVLVVLQLFVHRFLVVVWVLAGCFVLVVVVWSCSDVSSGFASAGLGVG